MFDLRIELKKVALKVQEILESIKSIKEALYDSGWIETTGTKGSPVKYRKKNGWVYVFVTSATTGDIPANTFTTVFTLPEGFRPSGVSGSIRLASDAAGGARYTTAIVGTDGNVQIYQTGASRYFNITGAFPVGGGYFLTILRRLLRGGVCYA